MEANKIRPVQAKDTLMNKDEMVGCSLVSKYPFKDVEDVINETCIHQAEITFPLAKQEGIKEVVKCENLVGWYDTSVGKRVFCVPEDYRNGKLKEWGIKDGS